MGKKHPRRTHRSIHLDKPAPLWEEPVGFNRVEQLSFIVPMNKTAATFDGSWFPTFKRDAIGFLVYAYDRKADLWRQVGRYSGPDAYTKAAKKAHQHSTKGI